MSLKYEIRLLYNRFNKQKCIISKILIIFVNFKICDLNYEMLKFLTLIINIFNFKDLNFLRQIFMKHILITIEYFM